MHRITENNKKT